jgi:ribosomal protein S6--L-glutamate ligase
MIVSFHPLFEADKNIICAGRNPNAQDLAAIKAAKAVILGQGCYQSLYEMARANCSHVFPNYDARFKYPGKIGQINLFRAINVSHPATEICPDVAAFEKKYGKKPEKLPFQFPLVFKLDWGGEGDTVYLETSFKNLQKQLAQTARFEKTGQTGFLLQEYIACQDRTLRVVVIGQQIISYWRISQKSSNFYSNLSKGAVIDSAAEPALQNKAIALVENMCRKTAINLAGFDVIFSSDTQDPDPMLLEINYFFGRRGLGGSEAYYKILQNEIQTWLAGI